MPGLPVYATQLRALFGDKPWFNLCSFNFTRTRFGLPPRCRASAVAQSGNAMHTSAVGACILWLFCYTVPVVPSPRSSVSSLSCALPRPVATPARVRMCGKSKSVVRSEVSDEGSNALVGQANDLNVSEFDRMRLVLSSASGSRPKRQRMPRSLSPFSSETSIRDVSSVSSSAHTGLTGVRHRDSHVGEPSNAKSCTALASRSRSVSEVSESLDLLDGARSADGSASASTVGSTSTLNASSSQDSSAVSTAAFDRISQALRERKRARSANLGA